MRADRVTANHELAAALRVGGQIAHRECPADGHDGRKSLICDRNLGGDVRKGEVARKIHQHQVDVEKFLEGLDLAVKQEKAWDRGSCTLVTDLKRKYDVLGYSDIPRTGAAAPARHNQLIAIYFDVLCGSPALESKRRTDQEALVDWASYRESHRHRLSCSGARRKQRNREHRDVVVGRVAEVNR